MNRGAARTLVDSIMHQPLHLGFSPCPNDTFIFHALVHGRVDSDLTWTVTLDDVESLNRAAEERSLDVTKISYHAYGRVAHDWWMLPSGGALGHGVGPLIVAKDATQSLEGCTMATPGGRTTANLLLDLYAPANVKRVVMRYDDILDAVARGDVDAGLIIHESRFTYRDHGVDMVIDLGAWWERETGDPIPLGGIAVRRDLPNDRIDAIANAVRASVRYAFDHPHESDAYVAEHAQEMAADVRRRHIDTYVNAFSLDVGSRGRDAVWRMLRMAADRGAIPPLPGELFWPAP